MSFLDELFDSYNDSDEEDDDDDDTRTCTRCGASGLEWRDTDDGDQLVEPTGDRHVCTIDTEGFDKLESA